MYSLAPISLSILSHVATLFYLVLVSIMSFWTRRRVELAASAVPSVDDIPSFSPQCQPLLRRSSSYSTSQGAIFDAPSSPVLRRSLSVSSPSAFLEHYSDAVSETGSEPAEPPSRRSSSPAPLASPIKLASHGRSGSLGSLAMANRMQGQYWIGDKEIPPEKVDPNAATDSEIPLFGDEMYASLSGVDLVARQKVLARRILCGLAVVRVMVDVPVVYLEATTYVTTYKWPSFFISAFDLVVVDLFIAFLLAIAPIICFAHQTSLNLPKSFEHDSYYLSTALLVLPLFATLQLPSTQAIQLYRMTAPILSAIQLLIARDQASMDYWQPMERKNRSRWAA